MEVNPFSIDIPDAVLDDLRQRLAHTRWPGEIPGAAWDYGPQSLSKPPALRPSPQGTPYARTEWSCLRKGHVGGLLGDTLKSRDTKSVVE